MAEMLVLRIHNWGYRRPFQVASPCFLNLIVALIVPSESFEKVALTLIASNVADRLRVPGVVGDPEVTVLTKIVTSLLEDDAPSLPVKRSTYVPAAEKLAVVLGALTLPNLNGTATDDGLPRAALSRRPGPNQRPGNVTFGNVNAPSTTASFSAAGTYVLRLTGSDGASSSSNDRNYLRQYGYLRIPNNAGKPSALSATFEAISVSATFFEWTPMGTIAPQSGLGSRETPPGRTPIPQLWIEGQASPAILNPYVNQVRGSIVVSHPGTTYEVALTFADPNGGFRHPDSHWYGDHHRRHPAAFWKSDFRGCCGRERQWLCRKSVQLDFQRTQTQLQLADTIRVMPGTYPPFAVSKSGAASGYIAIVGESRDQVFISGGSGNNITVNGDYIQLKKSSA